MSELEIEAIRKRNKELNKVNRALSTELIQVKLEKSHNEQLLDAMQNVLADFGYKLVDANEKTN